MGMFPTKKPLTTFMTIFTIGLEIPMKCSRPEPFAAGVETERSVLVRYPAMIAMHLGISEIHIEMHYEP